MVYPLCLPNFFPWITTAQSRFSLWIDEILSPDRETSVHHLPAPLISRPSPSENHCFPWDPSLNVLFESPGHLSPRGVDSSLDIAVQRLLGTLRRVSALVSRVKVVTASFSSGAPFSSVWLDFSQRS